MANAIRFYETGGPEVLRYEEVSVGEPGPGQVRLRHAAVGLNYADTYFRNGTYPIPMPNGLGVEAAGVVEALGEGVTNVAVGDRVTYTGFINTLGAYATQRLIPAAPLIKLPDSIAFETAAAMTMRGLTSAYLMRRIHAFKPGDSILLHAAAGGGWPHRRPVGQAAGADGDRHRVERRQGRAGPCPRLRLHHRLQP
nr:alcohol dehydrogenase catalytic domain-containing protein [Aeromonas media]